MLPLVKTKGVDNFTVTATPSIRKSESPLRLAKAVFKGGSQMQVCSIDAGTNFSAVAGLANGQWTSIEFQENDNECQASSQSRW